MTDKALLHTCCGPCASACVSEVRKAGYEPVLLFANSNIDTEAEYEKRLAEVRKLAAVDGVEVVALSYDHAEWLEEVAKGFEQEPERGRRCERCFRYNLAKTADYANRNGFKVFTTSLTVSPHKPSRVVFSAGRAAGAGFLEMDFKKKDGFLRSTRRAAELGMYRQSYCGCEFSKTPLTSGPEK